MNRTIVLIGIGGLLGSISRYLTASLFTKVFPSSFPYGTFIVNVVGCLLIGIIFGLSERLIVIGTHGQTGLQHLLMGSISENVVRHSKIPVMVVPSK